MTQTRGPTEAESVIQPLTAWTAAEADYTGGGREPGQLHCGNADVYQPNLFGPRSEADVSEAAQRFRCRSGRQRRESLSCHHHLSWPATSSRCQSTRVFSRNAKSCTSDPGLLPGDPHKFCVGLCRRAWLPKSPVAFRRSHRLRGVRGDRREECARPARESHGGFGGEEANRRRWNCRN